MLVKNTLPFNVAYVRTADILETMKGTFLTEIPQERPSSWGKTQESVFTTLLSFWVSFSTNFARKRNRFDHFHFDCVHDIEKKLKALNVKEPKVLSYIWENFTFFVKILKETVYRILWLVKAFRIVSTVSGLISGQQWKTPTMLVHMFINNACHTVDNCHKVGSNNV